MILVVSGPGGVGKGTLVSRLCEEVPGLWLSRSWTTRARRPGESPEAYTFVDREAFERHAAGGGFLEWAELAANGHLYGTPWPEAPPGTDVVLEIDVQGAAQVRERHPEAVVVLVLPPSREELAARMRKRGDDEDAIASRLAIADAEVEQASRLADHMIVNDDLERAVQLLAGILHGSRRSRTAPEMEN